MHSDWGRAYVAAVMDRATELLEAGVLGVLVRRELVHGVREEFLHVVEEVEGSCEAVVWPRKDTLCRPIFREVTDERRGEIEQDSSRLESVIDLSETRPSGQSVSDSQSALTHDPRTENSDQSDNEQPERPVDMQSCDQVEQSRDQAEQSHDQGGQSHDEAVQSLDHQPAVENSVVAESYSHLLNSLSEAAELPSDREGLLQRRAQLCMELMWMKQAIASRQQYLLWRDELEHDDRHS